MAGCLNGGSCLFDEGKDAFACSCSPQWRGVKCEMDTNECKPGKHRCDSNAFCNNTKGSYNCTCKPGYFGNGFNCTGYSSLGALIAHQCCDQLKAVKTEYPLTSITSPDRIAGSGVDPMEV
ncbi:unnamed protein product, partial [Porites lobata]